MERSTLKKDPRVASQSNPEQQDDMDSEFVELDDIPVKKLQSILERNEELRVDPPTPQGKLRRSIKMTRALERYSPSLHYLLTDSGQSKCYKEALHVKYKVKWEHEMDDEMESHKELNKGFD